MSITRVGRGTGGIVRRLLLAMVGVALAVPTAAASPAAASAGPTRPGSLQIRLAGDVPPAAVTVRIAGSGGYRKRVSVAGHRKLKGLRPGRYTVKLPTSRVAGVTYSTSRPESARVRVKSARSAQVVLTIRAKPTTQTAPTIAPASPAPPGVISDVLERINAARASGVRCDGTTGDPLPPISFSRELGDLAAWHAQDFAAGRQGDFLADLGRSGFTGSFIGESAVVCPKVADPDAVFAAMKDWEFSCVHLFDPQVDRIGIGYASGGGTTNAWVLTFGRSTS